MSVGAPESIKAWRSVVSGKGSGCGIDHTKLRHGSTTSIMGFANPLLDENDAIFFMMIYSLLPG